MDDPSQNIYVQRLKWILLISSAVSMIFLLLAAFEENIAGEWRVHQQAYKKTLIENAPNDAAREAAESMPIKFQQSFLPELTRIDRCVTCHVGVEDPAQTDAEQPLRTHSGDILKHHPISKFGCTVCHDGQSRAIKTDAAHGEVPHWPTPLLRGEAVYTSCGRCHYENDLYGAEHDLFARGGPLTPLKKSEINASVPGAKSSDERAIGRGKQLVLSSGCLGCHKYRGRGGTIGPDISHVGDKTKHDFDFHHITGEHTVFQWMFEHFKKPGEVVPGTLMPEMGLTDEQASDLAQYMLSLRRKNMPATHTPVPPHGDAQPVSGKKLFGMFCNSCHGDQGQGSMVLDPELMMLAEPPQELMTPAINNADTLAVASDDYLRHIIYKGRHDTNMIPWSADNGGLTNPEIDRLVKHLRSWQGEGADVNLISAARGDARRGRALYRARCSSCHDRTGKGGIGPSLNSPSFLAVASDQFLATAIVHGRKNTAMPAWKQLSAGEVSDLIAHIRTWEHKPADKKEVLSKLASSSKPSRRALRIGQTLYRANCGNCHGQKGEGSLGPSLNTDEFLSVVSDEYLYDSIVHGRPGTAMPSWKHLSVEDLVDIINYMRSFNKRNRRELEPYVARGDWDRGEILFTGMCAGCHGHSAEGATGSQLNNPLFLSSVSDSMLREWISYGRLGTEMRPFLKGEQGVAELSESQIEDIITYIRRFEIDRPTVTARPGMGIIQHGAQVYKAACASCHGVNGEGATGSALANPDFLRAASDGFITATMVMGRDGTEMRPMGKGAQSNVELSGEDLRNVVAFIRSWERQPPPLTIPQRYVMGANLDEGRTLYAGHCAGCHGGNGNDGWAPSLNNRDFLTAATDGFLQATIAVGRSNTPMRPFGKGAGGVADLSKDQINNIVAFIRTWAPEGQRPAGTGGTGGQPEKEKEQVAHAKEHAKE